MGASALDFDGVICNSIEECFNNSFAALKRLAPGVDLFEQMRGEWRDLFYLNRGVVRPARDYLKLWKWILDPNENHRLPLHSLDHILCTNKELLEFENAFFVERTNKINKNPSCFVKENPIYNEMLEAWNEIPRPIYIVTTKDEFSTRTLLNHYELKIDGLFSKDSGSKPKALRQISRMHNLAIQDVRFVDDNPDHVQDARSTGATSGLIGWGYGPYLNPLENLIKNAEELIAFLSHE
jgi:phosphoglycolate phosphatase-like HAD superfamily hydrolase